MTIFGFHLKATLPVSVMLGVSPMSSVLTRWPLVIFPLVLNRKKFISWCRSKDNIKSQIQHDEQVLKIFVHFRFNKYRKLFKVGIFVVHEIYFYKLWKKDIWRFSQNNDIENRIKIWVQPTACNETLYNFDSGKLLEEV